MVTLCYRWYLCKMFHHNALDTAVIYSTCGYVWLLKVTLGLHLVTTGYIRLPYRLML